MRTRILRLWAICLAVLATAPARAEPRPFRLQGNQILITVKLEGRDVPALLDTGASDTLIEAGLIKELGIRSRGAGGATLGVSGRTVDYGRTNAITLDLGGGFSARREFVVFAQTGSFAGGGARVIVGMDMLRRAMVSIDFDRMMIDFAKSSTSATPREKPLKFDGQWTHTLSIDLGEINGNFLIDTAASGALHLSERFNRNEGVLKGLPASQTLLAGIDGSFVQTISSLPAIEMAGARFENVPVTMASDRLFNSADGLIGMDLLKRFNVVIDYGRHQIWMTPNASLRSPFRRNRLGLSTSNAGSGAVRFVAPGSPAETAGFKSGEIVTSIVDASGASVSDQTSLAEGASVIVTMADGATRKLTARAYY